MAATFTAEALKRPLTASLERLGLTGPTVEMAPIGQVFQSALDPEDVFGHPLDHLIFLWRIEDAFRSDLEAFLQGDDGGAERLLEGIEQLAATVTAVPSKHGVQCVLSLPPMPYDSSIDLEDPTVTVRLGSLHRRCVDVVASAASKTTGCAVVDLDAIQRVVGAASSFDAAKWMLYRQPFGPELLEALSRALATAIVRSEIPTPKVLALDCDGTLWGGIVGEDGIGGIQLGEDFPGRAFTEFQKACLRLQSAGVMLAIVSKNDSRAVREVFDRHDAMVLKPEHISAWRVNWEPKSENLHAIAAELNVGLDSFVFVDDSTHEIGEVSARAPEVRTLLVPEDIEHLPGVLADSGLFRDMRTTAVDARRTTMMREQQSRHKARQALGEEEFLASLEMTVDYFAVRDEHLARVTQLIGKTNQFNLTTIRRGEAEVAKLVASPHHLVRAVRVADRFGDYGLVGVAIVELEADDAVIDTLLLSCRVLGRGVETAMLATLASEAGDRRLVGQYRPTPKNSKIADLLPSHGFVDIGEGLFELPAGESIALPSHIELQTEC